MRGGARMGAGRKPGARNQRTRKTIEAAKAQGQLPHEFLCAVSQGLEIDGHKPSFTERLDAAKAAAPFYAHKLQAVEQSGEVLHHTVSAEPLSTEEWERRYGHGSGAMNGSGHR